MAALGALVRKNRYEIKCGIQSIDNVVTISDQRCLEVVGAPGTGKTAVALAYAASALEAGARVAWISPRAFPLQRLASHSHFSSHWCQQIEFYRPSFEQLLALKTSADFIILEHYEHYVSNWRHAAAIAQRLRTFSVPVLVTGSLYRDKSVLRLYYNGFQHLGFNSITLTHNQSTSDEDMDGGWGRTTVCILSNDGSSGTPQLLAPDLVPSSWSDPGSSEVWESSKKLSIYYSQKV